ncbi:hypothetical protein ACFW2Y_04600 [Streptomyces sp. NPDC058877]|uniref:hypothetical protein n=1 Tax=unclassified Streptomyces TaxID=2593676 RepID=UPI003691DF12
MTTTTFPLATTAPRLRRTALALRAIRAFGGAAAGVLLLGDHGPAGVGVKDPRPAHLPAPGRLPAARS